MIEPPDGLEFDNQRVLNHNIGDEIANNDSFILCLDGLLRDRPQTVPLKLNHHALFVNGFEKSEAHVVVNAERATYDFLRQFFKFHPINPVILSRSLEHNRSSVAGPRRSFPPPQPISPLFPPAAPA